MTQDDVKVMRMHKRYWWVPLVLCVMAGGALYYTQIRHKAEMAERDAEFIGIIQSIVSKEPTLITDPNGVPIVYNPALAKFLKLDYDKIMQMNVAELIQAQKDSMEIAGGLKESRLRLPDGTELPVVVRYRPYPSKDPQIFDIKLKPAPAGDDEDKP